MNLEDILKAYGAIKDFTSFERPMFIGPHPDDIEFGCGGTVSKLKEAGKEMTYVIVTDGAAASGSLSEEEMKTIRYGETKKAAAFMNVQHIEFLDLEDGGDYEVIDVVRRLAPVICKYKPDIIFAPDPKLTTECHSDHLKTGEAVRLCAQLVQHPISLKRHHVNIENYAPFATGVTLAFYFSDDCNCVYPISVNNLTEKMQSLMIHQSQNGNEEAKLLLGYFKLKAEKLGQQVSTGLAEDYKVLVPLVQHCYSEGIHY